MFLRTDEMRSYLTDVDMSTAPVGRQIRYNHEDCPAGLDTKGRLYVKRAPDGVMFYCHHCGSKGYYRLKDRLYRASELIDEVALRGDTGHGLLHAELSAHKHELPMSEWSAEARLWWASYGFTETDKNIFAVQYARGRLWLWAAANLYQGRAFNATPKYLTLGDKSQVVYSMSGVDKNSWVVVEDLLSMYKVYKAQGNAVCLMGTSLSIATKNFLARRAKKVVLWLDDDTAGWNSATSLYTQLHGLIPDVRTIKDRQPKEHGLDYIKGIIHA